MTRVFTLDLTPKAMTLKNNTKRQPITQYIRFGLAGVLNTATDFLVLNALVGIYENPVGHSSYAAFKTISFLAAVAQSYLLNKHWVFGSQKSQKIAEMKEGGKFLAVSSFGFLVNVASSALVFAALSNFRIDLRLAANIGAMVGTMLVMIWNYTGYKSFVFRNSSPL